MWTRNITVKTIISYAQLFEPYTPVVLGRAVQAGREERLSRFRNAALAET